MERPEGAILQEVVPSPIVDHQANGITSSPFNESGTSFFRRA
jgi:hypothetical protein